MQDNVLKIVPIVLGILGFFVTVYLAFIKRSFVSPKLKLTIGVSGMFKRERIFSRLPKNNIFFVFNKTKTKNPLVCVPITINNTSLHPCYDIVVRISFPVGFDLLNTSFTFDDGTKCTCLDIKNQVVPEDVKYDDLGDKIQITYKIEKLRVGEGLAIPQILRAEIVDSKNTKIPSKLFDDYNSSSYKKRYTELKNVLSSMKLYVGIFSADFKPIIKQINLVSLNCVDENEILNTIKKMIELSWEGKYPKPGRYLNSPLWFLRPKPYNFKKLFQREYSEIIITDIDVKDYLKEEKSLFINKLKSVQNNDFIGTPLPPWRFFGDSFDLSLIGFKPNKSV